MIQIFFIHAHQTDLDRFLQFYKMFKKFIIRNKLKINLEGTLGILTNVHNKLKYAGNFMQSEKN